MVFVTMSKHIVIAITDALGAEAITGRLGVTGHSVRHARTTGVFPASWYGPLSGMCAEVGVSCPLEAFNWKSPSAASPENAGGM
jgi:hypothetical protein